jgi:hypothetical protein
MLKKLTLTVICFATLFSSLPAHADDTGPIQRLGTGIPTSIAASPDGKTLAVGSSIGVWFLDAATLQPFTFWDTRTWVNSVKYSTDGLYLRVDNVVYDTTSGSPAGVDKSQVGWIDHSCTSDRKLCTEIDIADAGEFGRYINSAWVIDTNTQIKIARLKSWPNDLVWSPDGTKLYGVTPSRDFVNGAPFWLWALGGSIYT